MTRNSLRLTFLFAIAFLLSACSFSLAEDVLPPAGSEQQPVTQATQPQLSGPLYPLVPPDTLSGAAIWPEKCAPCHGDQGLGDGPDAAQLPFPVAAIGSPEVARKSSPAEWYSMVTLGNIERRMPPFASLSDRQRWDVVAYAFSLSSSPESIAQGQAIYTESCARCHGDGGRGDGPDAVSLSVPPIDFSDQGVMADRPAESFFAAISQGVSPDMPGYADQLSETEIWALTDYMRSLTFASTQDVSTSGAYPYPAPGETGTAQVPAPSPTPLTTSQVVVNVVNGSGGDAPTDLSVTLYAFDDMVNTFSQTLTTGEAGVYTFADVEILPSRVFLAGVEYAGATYGSDIATVDPANPQVSLEVVVYDTSTDASVLTADRMHVFFDFVDPEFAQVVEVFIISNPTNRSIVAETPGGPVITFPLPEGYQNLEFQDGALGQRFQEVPGGFADTITIAPGMSEYQVVFAFKLPYTRRMDFAQQLALPVNAVVVMIPDSGIKINSDIFEDGGTRDFQDTTYHLYNASSLDAGSQLAFTLSGRRSSAGSSLLGQFSTQNLAVGLGVFGLALVLGGLWLYRRSQKAALETIEGSELGEGESASSAAIPEDENVLMDAIIALDDQYRSGELPEEAYLKRRAELKEQLKRQMMD